MRFGLKCISVNMPKVISCFPHIFHGINIIMHLYFYGSLIHLKALFGLKQILNFQIKAPLYIAHVP